MQAMNRRDFIKLGAILSPAIRAVCVSTHAEQPEIAFTFDDPKTDDCGGMRWQEINARMLAALSRHQIKAVLFVTGKRVDSEAGRNLVAEWDKFGHAIGNHSYSHPIYLYRTPRETSRQMERTQQIIAETTGREPRLARPPCGVRTPAYFAAARRLGLRLGSGHFTLYAGFPRVQGERVGTPVRVGDWTKLFDGSNPG